MTRLFIGLISGTSMDGVDAALVDLAAAPRLLATHTQAYPDELRARVAELCSGARNELEKYARLDGELGVLFADAALALLTQAGVRPRQVEALGSHGQTVRHYPGLRPGSSLQAADPNIIATRTGITTVADFRRRDLSVGGQGAPLLPVFHDLLFRKRGVARVVLNLGGIANITILPADPRAPVAGFDTGPANTLMDHWASRHLGLPMDVDGKWASGGRVDNALLELMLEDRYFAAAPPKSTGTDYFGLKWLDRRLKRRGGRPTRRNVQTTLCELSARTIVDAIVRHAAETREVLVCGGGVHNLALMFRLQVLLGDVPVRSIEDFGVAPDWIEAMAFAWLAQQTLAGRPGNLPAVTGASRPVTLGGIYPGG
jgi:anhydro-N-acetylmuramic acid kinase